MRFIVMIKADKNYEAGIPPSQELMAAIGTISADMARAGVLVDAVGLLPSSKGARLRLADGQVTVTDGPFAEAKEVVGGYAIVQAASKAEAIELGKRFLLVHAEVLGRSYECESEIRQLADPPRSGSDGNPR